MRKRLEKVQKKIFDLLKIFEIFFENFFFQNRQTKVTPFERGSKTKWKSVNLFFLNLIQCEIIAFQRPKTAIFALESHFHHFACMAVPLFITSREPLNKTTQHIFFRRQLSGNLTPQITRRMRAISPCGSRARAHLRSTDDLKDRESNTIRKRIKN